MIYSVVMPTLDIPLSGGFADIERAAEVLSDFCADHGLPPKVAFDFNLAIDELATNTLSYGFPDEAFAPGAARRLDLSVRLSDDGWMTADLIDNGVAYDPFTQAPPPVLVGTVDERPIGGLGVHFARRLMDEVAYRRSESCNHVTLRRRVPNGAGDGGAE